MKKITLKYCRELLNEFWADVPHSYDDGGEMNPEILKGILEKANPDSRFRVSFDDGEDPTWDLDGPGISYGTIWWELRCDAEEGRDALNKILRHHFGPTTMVVRYTPDAHLAKALLEGNCCPACGSGDISLESYEYKSALNVVQRSCESCNSEWEEVYTLQSYQNLKID